MTYRFLDDSPIEYWNDIINDHAFFALSLDKILRFFCRVQKIDHTFLKRWVIFLLLLLNKSATTLLDWPNFQMINLPILFNLKTSGIEVKTSKASSAPRLGPITSTTFSASSYTKISYPIKILASDTSFLNCSKMLSSRSFFSKYPTQKYKLNDCQNVENDNTDEHYSHYSTLLTPSTFPLSPYSKL